MSNNYGLKIWTAAAYLSFDSNVMKSYPRIVSSGDFYLGNNQSQTVTIPTGYDYVYVMGPTRADSTPFQLTYSSTPGVGYTSFTVKNISGLSATYGYNAIIL